LNAAYSPANSSYRNSLVVTLPEETAGDYYFVVKADSDQGGLGRVSEYEKEGDNGAATAEPAFAAFDVFPLSEDRYSRGVKGDSAATSTAWA
jgi:hypothetical protein